MTIAACDSMLSTQNVEGIIINIVVKIVVWWLKTHFVSDAFSNVV